MLQVVEPLGNESLLYITVADRLFVVRTPGQPPARADDAVNLAVAPEHLHFFDRGSGRCVTT